MLILTRRLEEAIFIGKDIQITVLKIQGNQVQLGLDAPQEVTIHREEVYRRNQREKTVPKTLAD